MNKALNSIIRNFCMALMDNKVLPQHKLRQQWDAVCTANPIYFHEKRCIEGMFAINKFYQWAARNEIIVADVGSPYVINLKYNADIYSIEGNFGIIIINKNKQPENLKINFTNKMAPQEMLELDMFTALDHLAFKTVFGRELNGTQIYNVKADKSQFVVKTNSMEEKRISNFVVNISRAIQQQIYYPHQSPLCSNCAALDFCRLYGNL